MPIGGVLVAMLIASAAWAQRFRVVEGPGMPLHPPPANFSDGAFTICKLIFTSNRREANGFGWSTDYPFSGLNLMLRSSELTKTRISRDGKGEARYWTVHLSDQTLFDCPFLVGSDVGTIDLAPIEVARLREYLLKGGFLWVDDFWGEYAWGHWVRELRKALPATDYPIVDLPLSHPLFHTQFEIRKLAQIPSINFFFGGGTSERGADSAVPHVRAVADRAGRLVVVMTHNTDFGDSWEREGDDATYFANFGPDGYAFGINTFIYGLTH